MIFDKNVMILSFFIREFCTWHVKTVNSNSFTATISHTMTIKWKLRDLSLSLCSKNTFFLDFRNKKYACEKVCDACYAVGQKIFQFQTL